MSKLTPEEIKEEISSIKVPKIVSFADKFWFSIGKYILIIGILLMFPIGVIINETNNMELKFILSQIALYLFFFLLIGIGGLQLVSHFIKNRFVKKHSARLGLTIEEWNYYVEEFDLKTY